MDNNGEYKHADTSSGTLPDGMTLALDGSNVVISGTPTTYAAGGATITVEVTDQNGDTATASVTLSAIAKGTPVVAKVSSAVSVGDDDSVDYSELYTIKDSEGTDISGNFESFTYSDASATAGSTGASSVTGIDASGTATFKVSAIAKTPGGTPNWNDIKVILWG